LRFNENVNITHEICGCDSLYDSGVAHRLCSVSYSLTARGYAQISALVNRHQTRVRTVFYADRKSE
jgi:hypothetical protein